MGDHCRAVHVVRAVLVHTVPVDRSVLVAQSVVHVHDQTITLVDFDDGKWPLSVDAHDLAIVHAIWVGGGPCHVPVVGNGFGLAGLERDKSGNTDDEPCERHDDGRKR